MALEIVFLIAGFVLLVIGADWLVNGASALAKKYNVSDLAIGLTIVAFGTSAPELVVNVFAAAQGSHDIVLGNIIGSNNFNLLVILGIAGIITPLAVQHSTVWKEIPFSLLAVAVLFIFANDIFSDGTGVISRFDGIILLAFFGWFLWYVGKQLKNDPAEAEIVTKQYPGWKMALLIVGGLAALIAGGRLVVTSAVDIARVMGMSEKLIGLTIVAAGTSLPELATSVVAAIKKNNDIAVGNIVGSNIFNIFLILGVSSVINPVSFNTVFNV
ncbi:MAG: calcium/sodium antiporter, partial [Bacteroidales bacterium]|nr:calcium/sodium antiporter [Bacteroidales bacterium]